MGKKLILKGNVQGVFCRDYCSKNAQKLGLKGSATNLYDGTVQIILVTNNQDKINGFINAIKTNQYNFRFHGNITDIEISDYTGLLSGDYLF